MTQDTEQKLDLEALKLRAKKEFFFFAKGILGFDGINEHIHGPVCMALEDRKCRRKLFVLPRTWYKTTLCSIAYPIWLAINNPNIRILIVQNSATNSKKKLAVIRQLWEGCDLLRALFPELLPTRTSIWTADSLCLTRSKSFPEGTFEAVGTNTKVTSRHYDLVIEDDTVAPDLDELGNECLAPTDADVQKAIGWHKTNVLPLLNNIEKDEILVVGTRWYDQDLIRYIMDNEKQYKVITRACRENDEGQPDYRGHLTYPERFSEAVLNELETNMGPYMFGCNPAEAPILMANFRSKHIAEVMIGDEVIGFTTRPGEHSRLVRSRVISTNSRKSKIVELEFKSGRKIRCTSDHNWLDASQFKKRASGRRFYRPAQVGMSLAYVYNPFDPLVWDLDRVGRQADIERNAWFAGLFDGEGSVQPAGVNSGELSICQSPTYNPVISEMMRVVMRASNFDWIESRNHMDFVFGTLWEDRRRFLINYPSYKGRCLIPGTLFGSRWIKEKDPIVKITPCGEEQVYCLETETGNYICWGYASKNCLYMNTPVRTEDMAFKSKWFEYFDVSPQLSQLAVYTTIDPATDPKLSKSGKVDYSVVMTCGKDMVTGFVYVLDYFHGQVNPGEMSSEIFKQVRKWRPVLVGYEDVAYQKSLEYWLKELMRQEELFFVLEPLKLSKQKDAKSKRIAALIPLFAAGVIKFRTWMKALESELLKFPLGANDDLPDCLSMQLHLWQMTRSLETYRMIRDGDPMLLDTALDEIDKRKKVSCAFSTINAPSRFPRMLDTLTFN